MINAKVKNTFDTDTLRSIESMEMDVARRLCLDLIHQSNTRTNKKHALIRDIENAPTSKEMSRIMWNVLLAGEGLATTNSKWQATFS